MPTPVEGVRLPSAPPTVTETSPPRPLARTASGDEFARVLRGVGKAIDRGERIMAGAASGTYATLDAGALIALQAGIYRYSEAIDLTAKLIDRVTTAARTVLQAGH